MTRKKENPLFVDTSRSTGETILTAIELAGVHARHGERVFFELWRRETAVVTEEENEANAEEDFTVFNPDTDFSDTFEGLAKNHTNVTHEGIADQEADLRIPMESCGDGEWRVQIYLKHLEPIRYRFVVEHLEKIVDASAIKETAVAYCIQEYWRPEKLAAFSSVTTEEAELAKEQMFANPASAVTETEKLSSLEISPISYELEEADDWMSSTNLEYTE